MAETSLDMELKLQLWKQEKAARAAQERTSKAQRPQPFRVPCTTSSPLRSRGLVGSENTPSEPPQAKTPSKKRVNLNRSALSERCSNTEQTSTVNPPGSRTVAMRHLSPRAGLRQLSPRDQARTSTAGTTTPKKPLAEAAGVSDSTARAADTSTLGEQEEKLVQLEKQKALQEQRDAKEREECLRREEAESGQECLRREEAEALRRQVEEKEREEEETRKARERDEKAAQEAAEKKRQAEDEAERVRVAEKRREAEEEERCRQQKVADAETVRESAPASASPDSLASYLPAAPGWPPVAASSPCNSGNLLAYLPSSSPARASSPGGNGGYLAAYEERAALPKMPPPSPATPSKALGYALATASKISNLANAEAEEFARAAGAALVRLVTEDVAASVAAPTVQQRSPRPSAAERADESPPRHNAEPLSPLSLESGSPEPPAAESPRAGVRDCHPEDHEIKLES